MSNRIASKRIEIVDVLRGFAIMAIMLLHNIERFNLYVFPGGWQGFSTTDRAVWDTLFFLFGGKTYSIFALLFGFTFFIMLSKAREKGQDFGVRFLWRLLLLAGFACINAAFFPGEVLMLYAIVGVVLFLVRKWNNKVVLALAVFFLLQPVELFYFTRQLLDSSWEIPAQINWGMHGAVKAYLNEGTFAALVKGNVTTGQVWSMMWAIENGRFLQTAGLFLMGFLIARKGWFTDLKEKRKVWLTVYVVAIAATTLFYFVRLEVFENRDFIYRRSLGVAVDMWWKLSFTFIWVSLFALLYQIKVFQLITEPFKAYGKMSLTNYVTQSILGSLLYFSYAFNLAPKIGITASLGVGIVLFMLQITFCNWWIGKYGQGPLEKLWHRLTWVSKEEGKLKLARIPVRK